VSQLQPDQRPDVDPLLAFSIEPGAVPPPPHLNKPVAPPQVAASASDRAFAAEIIATRLRLDRLEKALEEATRQVSVVKSEVATLVGETADIRKHSRRREPEAAPPSPRSGVGLRWRQLVTPVAGVLIGVSAGIWFWLSTSSEPLATPPAASVATEQPALPTPPPTAAIVPVAAVATTDNAATRATPAGNSAPAPRIGYVGTLTIDSDPAGEVFIDRRPAGRTPLRATNLKAGSHLVWIQRDGYTRFTRVVSVAAGRVTRLVADLEPLAAR
jgi:hypothetical protein